ncbi:MAG: peroxiredoxin-like family protein [Actinomycetota bacterium]
MRDRLDELGPTTRVALITFTDTELITSYRLEHELPFPVLTDPERTTYRAYGLERGSLTSVWGWRAARRYLEIFRRNGLRAVRSLARPTEDTRQLGGDFVVGADGRLVFAFRGEGPHDRPSVDELVAAVRRSEP